jgi:DNA helicase-2/ATP-dependent DNA helicase PcrA
MNRVLKKLKIDEQRIPPKWALSRIHAQKREGRGPDDVDVIEHGFDPLLLEVYKEYEAMLRQCNAVDFEDLILRAVRIVENPKGDAGNRLRSRFNHVLVDEFQDTNAIQYRLVRALALNTQNLCVVGDDDQSIYRWRGANVQIIRNFASDFAGAEVVKLEQNYRSTANIVAAALGVISPSMEREPKRLWTASEAGDLVQIRAVTDERAEARFVVGTIEQEIARGVVPSDIAVFYRVHAQSRVLEEAFRASKIRYQIIGGMKFFERAEIKDLLAYLRLIENPRSDTDFYRIINTPPRGIGDKTVERIATVAAERTLSAVDAMEIALREDEVTGAAKKRLTAFYKLFSSLRQDAKHQSPQALAAQIVDRSGYRERLQSDGSPEAEARLGNLQELLGSIAEYQAEALHLGQEPSLAGYLERVSLVSAVDTMEDTPSVSLMTVHSAKGLEFTSVFVTGMEEEIFPYRGLDAGEIEELEEERRLAYVAFTRARERLYIVHAGMRTLFGRTRYGTPSRFLHDLPADVVVHEGTANAPPRPSAFGGSYGRGLAAPRARRLAPGERFVDTEVFDDLPADEAGLELRPGTRVRHRSFGVGVVERVEGGSIPMVVARFSKGTKKIRADFLELG